MLTFNPQYYPYSSRRSVVYAANGMCCAGNPTVTSIGLQTMLKGGNAIDAAVAMAAAPLRSFGTRARSTASTAQAPRRKPCRSRL